MRKSVFLSMSLALATPGAWAQATSQPSFGAGLAQMLLGLGGVLVLLVGSLWLLKRLTAVRGPASGMMRVVAATAVGGTKSSAHPSRRSRSAHPGWPRSIVALPAASDPSPPDAPHSPSPKHPRRCNPTKHAPTGHSPPRTHAPASRETGCSPAAYPPAPFRKRPHSACPCSLRH